MSDVESKDQQTDYQTILTFPLHERIRLAKSGSTDIISRLVYDKEEKVLFCIMENPNVTEKIILSICRRRVVPSRVLETISKDNKWMRNYQIKYAFVSNPRTPVYLSLRFIKSLYRQDLANLIRDVSVPASVRINAEAVLKERIKELTRGDKITLAHNATAPVLRILLMEGDSMVLQSALQNARLNETDLLYMLNTCSVSDEALSIIVANKRWSSRYEVRLAIVRNPNTSEEILRTLLQNFLQQDLQEIIETSSIPLDARIEAKKVLKNRISRLARSEKILLAQKGKDEILSVLLYEDNEDIYRNLLKNQHLRDEHVLTISHKSHDPYTLAEIARNEKWRSNPRIALALYHNSHIPDYIKTHLEDFIEESAKE